MKYLPRLAAASMAVAAVSPVHAAMDYFVTTQTEYDALNSTTFNPGDSIFLQGGTTFNGGLFFTDSPGNLKQNPIYLGNLDVSGFGRSGVVVGGFNGSAGYNDVRITHTVAYQNRSSGIATFGDTRINSRDAAAERDVALPQSTRSGSSEGARCPDRGTLRVTRYAWTGDALAADVNPSAESAVPRRRAHHPSGGRGQ